MNETNNNNKIEKFSYSKLNTYEGCAYKYKLQYIDKHFVDSSTIANEFGTLVHLVEETIAKDIIANNNEPYFMIDDSKYIDLFINGNEEEKVLGIKDLKAKYPEDFYIKDKSGQDYNEKANIYLNFGIYRLRDYLSKNHNLQLIGVEQPFRLEYHNYLFQGFIDRAFKDITTGQIIIEDIKTWSSIDNHELTTPLQFVFYCLAAEQLYNVSSDTIKCSYELPLAQDRYDAGTKGFMKRGLKKIDKLLTAIEEKHFEPKPSPLCYWCIFSKTFPNQPEEAKNLCPYYCNWTKDKKDFSSDFVWMGEENHQAILEAFINNGTKPQIKQNESISTPLPSTILSIVDSDRIQIIRRF